MMEELIEEFPPGYPNETFVAYRGMRIFYKYKQEHQEWFFQATYIAEETVSGYPSIGCGWFKSREEGLAWGLHIVDAERAEERENLWRRRPCKN